MNENYPKNSNLRTNSQLNPNLQQQNNIRFTNSSDNDSLDLNLDFDSEDQDGIANNYFSDNNGSLEFSEGYDDHKEVDSTTWNWKFVAIYASILSFFVGGFSGWIVKGFFTPSLPEVKQSVVQESSISSVFSTASSIEKSSQESSSVSSIVSSNVKFAITVDPEKTNTNKVNVRSEACSNSIVGSQNWGAIGKILSTKPTEKTCFGRSWKWHQLEWSNGIKGWTAENFLSIKDQEPDLDTDIKFEKCTPNQNEKIWCIYTPTNADKVRIPNANSKYVPELGKSLFDRQYILNFCYNCATANVHLLQVYEYFFYDGFLGKVSDYSTAGTKGITDFEKALDDYSKDGAKSNSSLQSLKSSQSSSSSSVSQSISSQSNSQSSSSSSSVSSSLSSSQSSVNSSDTSSSSSQSSLNSSVSSATSS